MNSLRCTLVFIEIWSRSLESYQCPGQLGTFQFQVTNITIQNLARTAINYDLYLWFVNEGTFNVYGNTSISQIGVVSKMDVLNSHKSPAVDYKMIKNIYGGDFWSDLKSVGSDVLSGLKQGFKFAKEDVLPVVKEVAPLLALGLGEGDCPYCPHCKGMGCAMCMGEPVGQGVLVGGRRARRSRLRR